jgi:hypothetical protein
MPEGTADDDTDQDGGMPDDADDDDPSCPPVADIWRARTEDLGDNHARP